MKRRHNPSRLAFHSIHRSEWQLKQPKMVRKTKQLWKNERFSLRFFTCKTVEKIRKERKRSYQMNREVGTDRNPHRRRFHNVFVLIFWLRSDETAFFRWMRWDSLISFRMWAGIEMQKMREAWKLKWSRNYGVYKTGGEGSVWGFVCSSSCKWVENPRWRNFLIMTILCKIILNRWEIELWLLEDFVIVI